MRALNLNSKLERIEITIRQRLLSILNSYKKMPMSEFRSNYNADMWTRIIRLMYTVGVTAEKIQEEVSASPAIQKKWLKGEPPKRYQTARLMTGPFSELVKNSGPTS